MELVAFVHIFRLDMKEKFRIVERPVPQLTPLPTSKTIASSGSAELLDEDFAVVAEVEAMQQEVLSLLGEGFMFLGEHIRTQRQLDSLRALKEKYGEGFPDACAVQISDLIDNRGEYLDNPLGGLPSHVLSAP